MSAGVEDIDGGHHQRSTLNNEEDEHVRTTGGVHNEAIMRLQ